MGNFVLKPNVSLSLVSADMDVSNAPQKVLIVGQKSVSGSASSGTLYSNFPNDGSEGSLFGNNSQLTNAIKVFKSIAPNVQLDVIPVSDNGSGLKSIYTLTFSGTATESGTVTVYLGSRKKYKATVAVTSGQLHTAISSALNVAINTYVSSAEGISCPFSSSNSTGVVSLTYVNAGTCGNSVPIGFELKGKYANSLSGITCTLAVSTSGSNDPTNFATSAIFDVIGNNRYQGIIWPDSATFGTQATWLDSRFNVNNKILDGVLFSRVVDSYANVLDAGATSNYKSGVLFGDKKLSISSSYIGPASGEPSLDVCAAFAAIRAIRLTSGAAISQYLTTSASSDQFGGPALASLPYFNTTIPGMSLPVTGQGFTDSEIGFLEAAGISIIGQNSTRTNVLVGTVSTTYKTDPAGNSDISWKYLNYVDTMSNIREYFFNNYKKRFAQSRLTEGTVIRGRDAVNKSMFEAYTDQLYGDLSSSDYVLTQAGEDALNFFKKNRIVSLDLATGTISVSMLVPIVTQTRNIIGTIKIAFSTEG